MTATFIAPGDAIDFTAGSTLTAGTGVLSGSLFGVVAADVASGETGTLEVEGIHNITKATGEAWTFGAKLYWDDTAKNVTTTVGANTLVGLAAKAAGEASGATSGWVKLTPNVA